MIVMAVTFGATGRKKSATRIGWRTIARGMTTKAHDGLFRSVFGDAKNAADELKCVLPEACRVVGTVVRRARAMRGENAASHRNSTSTAVEHSFG